MDADSYSEQLVAQFELNRAAAEQMRVLAERCVSLEISGTAVRTAGEAMRLHIADSLSGLAVVSIAEAESLCDIGTGVGFPGIVLAIARPELQVTLVDAVRKKVEAAGKLVKSIGLENVECLWSRAEELGAVKSPHRESFDVVTARALAPLTTLIEYSAPLLVQGGSLVAWKGAIGQAELADAAAAEDELGFERGTAIATRPFPDSRDRHLYVTIKSRPCDERYPRRAGVPLRKPITAG